MLTECFGLPIQVDAEQHAVLRNHRTGIADFASSEQQLQGPDLRFDDDDQDDAQQHGDQRHHDILAAPSTTGGVGDELRFLPS